MFTCYEGETLKCELLYSWCGTHTLSKLRFDHSVTMLRRKKKTFIDTDCVCKMFIILWSVSFWCKILLESLGFSGAIIFSIALSTSQRLGTSNEQKIIGIYMLGPLYEVQLISWSFSPHTLEWRLPLDNMQHMVLGQLIWPWPPDHQNEHKNITLGEHLIPNFLSSCQWPHWSALQCNMGYSTYLVHCKDAFEYDSWELNYKISGTWIIK